MDIAIYADQSRHLVCTPYSRANLLVAADTLGIPRHWLHVGRGAHIDIPARRVEDVLSDPRVRVVSSRSVLAIIRGASNGS